MTRRIKTGSSYGRIPGTRWSNVVGVLLVKEVIGVSGCSTDFDWIEQVISSPRIHPFTKE